MEEEGFSFDHSEVFFMCINLALPHTPLQILYTFHKVPQSVTVFFVSNAVNCFTKQISSFKNLFAHHLS